MQNEKSIAIQRLRSVASDEKEAPLERLRAAHRLLIDHGSTDRNVPAIRKVVREYERNADSEISSRAQKLKIKLAKYLGVKTEAKSIEIPYEPELSETEEPPAIVAGTSASEVPRSSPLTVNGLHEVVRRVVGVHPYEGLPQDLATLSITQQNLIIEALVHDCGLSLSVQEIQSVIDNLNSRGLASNFPGLVQVARRYLEVTRTLLDQLNRDKPGVSQQ